MDYNTDGRDAALAEIRKWLMDNMPVNTDYANRTTNFLTHKQKQKLLTLGVKKFKERAKISMAWRNSLRDRLTLRDDDIVRATNTVLTMIENELANDGTVRLNNFGDFTLHKGEQIRVHFKPDRYWLESMNEPTYADDIGLGRRLTSRRRLERRI